MEEIELNNIFEHLNSSKYGLGQLVYFKHKSPLFGNKEIDVIGMIDRIRETKFEDKYYYNYQLFSNMGRWVIVPEDSLKPVGNDLPIKIIERD